MNTCKKCKRGVLVCTETVIHVVDKIMVAGDVYKCTRCDEKTVKTRVYQQIKVRLNEADEAKQGWL